MYHRFYFICISFRYITHILSCKYAIAFMFKLV